ncbi:MAG: ABC transporter ATP-binding protein [Firmicutes bacterium]|nr:ABC transporter ATP-binding protein [Bacillota bacterium]
MVLLEVGELVLGYDSKPIASDINFVVNSGDYLCIVGENGTGKSTLLKAILGLNPPISGWLEFNLAQNEVGYMPQQTNIQRDFPASVKEVVMSGNISSQKWWQPFYNAKQKELANNALQKTGLADLENKCYRELSGGQQQRVLLARALVSAKKLIILDEPTAGLDPDAARDFYETLKNLNSAELTIIMVTHDIENAKKYASHILHLKKEGYVFSPVDNF